MSRWTHTGKQVLQDGKHFADAAGEIEAMMIVNAMRGLDTLDDRRSTPTLNLNDCRVRREGDEMACACGLRWDVNDTDPPLCVHRAPR